MRLKRSNYFYQVLSFIRHTKPRRSLCRLVVSYYFDIVEVFKVCPRTGVLLGMSAHHARSVLHLLTDCSRLLSSILLLPDLVHRGAPLRSSAMVRLLILGALFHPSGLIARGAVGPLSPSLHLSTRLVPVSTGNSTNKEGS